jgi:HEAT repeat protein
LPGLGEALKDKELSFRVAAAMALLTVGKEGQAELVKAAADSQPAVRLTAIQALSSIEKEELDADGVKALAAALDDADGKVRQAAAGGVAGQGMRARELAGGLDVPKSLFARLGDKEIGVRRMAIVALGQVGLDDEADLTRLAQGLKDKDFGVRYFTVQALAQYSTEETASELRKLILGHIAAGLADKDRRVQYAAGHILVQEGGLSVPGLIKQLDQTPAPAKTMIVLVLAEIGAAAVDAVPVLEKLKKDGSAEVRRAATMALKRIQE